ncbi:MAG TPA: hypothetical protein VK783_10095 [Bacteroidia bacterium]|nr:hypothetical protein [Bacteroidia bacterium]
MKTNMPETKQHNPHNLLRILFSMVREMWTSDFYTLGDFILLYLFIFAVLFIFTITIAGTFMGF